MSFLGGIATLVRKRNHGLKPILNRLGSTYFSTSMLSTSSNITGISKSVSTASVITLSDTSIMTLSDGHNLEIAT